MGLLDRLRGRNRTDKKQGGSSPAKSRSETPAIDSGGGSLGTGSRRSSETTTDWGVIGDDWGGTKSDWGGLRNRFGSDSSDDI